MKLVNRKTTNPRVVSMTTMKPGQIGVIAPGQPYAGLTVLKVGRNETTSVVSLDGGDEFWNSSRNGEVNTILVNLLNPGTVLELEADV